ncbi:MAG: hypothetical protein SF029_00280 [bacterium]|nr:hypothetical protein [bacterium]
MGQYIAFNDFLAPSQTQDIYYRGVTNTTPPTRFNFSTTSNPYTTEYDPDWWGPSLTCPAPDGFAAASVPCQIVSPTPTIDPIQALLGDLIEYGIAAERSGVPANFDDEETANAWIPEPWTQTELQEMVQGVRDTATALDIARNGSYDSNRALALFRTVIIGNQPPGRVLTLIRTTGGYSFQSSSCNGKTLTACTDNSYHFIVFDGITTNLVTKYVLVHELGHRFNARSDSATAGSGAGRSCASLYGRIEGTRNFPPPNCPGVPLQDPQGYLVMGMFLRPSQTPAWDRGQRGWGSGPNDQITQFQQHPPQVPAFVGEDLQTQIDETAADMFLNWIYRTLSDYPPTLYQVVPGSWQGFLNMSWNRSRDPGAPTPYAVCYPNPCNDLRYSGDRRYEWMSTQMAQIYTQNNNSWFSTPTPTPTP